MADQMRKLIKQMACIPKPLAQYHDVNVNVNVNVNLNVNVNVIVNTNFVNVNIILNIIHVNVNVHVNVNALWKQKKNCCVFVQKSITNINKTISL